MKASYDPETADLKRLVVEHGMAAIPLFGILLDYPDVDVNVCSCPNPECREAGKHPRIAWGDMQRPPAWGQIEEWMRRLSRFMFDPFNWAFHCGVSRVVVVDVDPRNGGLESWASLVDKYGVPPATARDSVATRGYHLWFRAPENTLAIPNPNQGKLELAPGVDLKYGKGYVNGPPSMHRCGHAYRWDDGLAPWQQGFAPLPQWIIDLACEIEEKSEAKRKAVGTASCGVSSENVGDGGRLSRSMSIGGTDRDRLVHRARTYVARIPGAVSGRGGSKVTSHVACLLLNEFSLAFDDALAIFAEWNQTCSPPWTKADLVRKLEWAGRQPGIRGRLADSTGDRSSYFREVDAELRAAGIDLDSITNATEYTAATTEATPATDTPDAAAIFSRAAAAVTDESPANPYDHENEASRNINAARRDFDRFPCHHCRYPVNRDNQTGEIRVRKVRCEKRGRCPGCTAYLNSRETENARLRFRQAEAKGQATGQQLLYITTVADADWRRFRKRLTAAGADYLAVAEADGTWVKSTSSWLVVMTTAITMPGSDCAATIPTTADAALSTFTTRLAAYDGNLARPVRSSHRWKLPSLRQQEADETRLGMGDPTLTPDRIVKIAEQCGATATHRGTHRGDPRIQWTMGIRAPDPDAASRIVDALFVGELLPDFDEVDPDWGISGLRSCKVRDGTGGSGGTPDEWDQTTSLIEDLDLV